MNRGGVGLTGFPVEADGLSVLATVLGLSSVFVALGLLAVALPAGVRRHQAVYGLSGVLSLVLLVCDLTFLLGYGSGGAAKLTLLLPVGLPGLGSHWRLDSISALFLALVHGCGALTSLYGLGYARHEEEPERVLPLYPLFLAGMSFVPLAADAFSFLLAWEFMSLSSWGLVVSHHRDPEAVRAGYIYLLMAVFGSLSLLLAFLVLAGDAPASLGLSRLTFAAMDAAPHGMETSRVVLLLALLGAGSKAGLVPLHVWLPLAHPAAPSHVSALMSGVMTKVALYGLIRIVFDLMGKPEWWWGAVILTVGGITAVMGILAAVMERDLKRLLAYSTVENIGIIACALGLALAFRCSPGLETGAALALTAGLFHIVNHALFKSLLFFGAGAVLNATGTRNMDMLGGLIHRMPYTTGLFILGAAAISALPPLNGFASEWLLFQAILLSPDLPQWLTKLLVPAMGALLALAAALAATCFVRAIGITFLGRPRTLTATGAVEADRASLSAMIITAALCVLAGGFPGLVLDALRPVVQALVDSSLALQRHNDWLLLVPVAPERSSYNPLLLLSFVVFSTLVGRWLSRRVRGAGMRRGNAWDCGFPQSDPDTQYTSGSFAQPIRRVFGGLAFDIRETVTMPVPGEQRPARHSLEMKDPLWEQGYERLGRTVLALAGVVDPFHQWPLRRYLGVMFAALVLLLTVLAL